MRVTYFSGFSSIYRVGMFVITILVMVMFAGCWALPDLPQISAPSTTIEREETAMIFDFTQPESLLSWYAVNDNVMGGVSQGAMQATATGTALFTGEISFENNGGFSTVQANFDPVLDVSDFTGLVLRVRGDGKQYGVYLRDSYSQLAHQAVFTTTAGVWEDIRLPFSAFLPTRFGSVIRAEPFNPARMRSISLLIEFKQEGPFTLEVALITGYNE